MIIITIIIIITNSPPLTIFLIMPFLSRLMSRHCILTSQIMKELMLFVFSFKKALINISLRKPFIILTMNNFTFNSKHYHQKHGTAMGTRMAPSYANLFLSKFERDALLNSPHQPYLWLRFIDDIFMIWTAGPEKLKIFVDYLNNLHSTIKFTCSLSHSNIPFLDVMVSVKDGSIETDLYTKPTDKHQYLLVSSCHPQHTTTGIAPPVPILNKAVINTLFILQVRPTRSNLLSLVVSI